jgi:hypothetical protein
MTNEEAAKLSPILTSGSVKDKTSLAVGLARFGPLSVQAARQVAPNDYAFENLVGLAGHDNQAVGLARVNQVIAGQEILKTKPKLIDKANADRSFDSMVGQALHFLPSVRTGIRANAEAILANEANDRGWSEWNQAQGKWFAAVNSALGAYTRNGEQIGGLHGFNGGMTVLPENMGEKEFEERIARSHGREFQVAGNGVPMFGNGQPANAADVKKLQWVPVRDGIYRVTDGNAYLSKEGGGFYEVDIRKLPKSDLNAQLAARGYKRY